MQPYPIQIPTINGSIKSLIVSVVSSIDNFFPQQLDCSRTVAFYLFSMLQLRNRSHVKSMLPLCSQKCKELIFCDKILSKKFADDVTTPLMLMLHRTTKILYRIMTKPSYIPPSPGMRGSAGGNTLLQTSKQTV